MRRRKWIRPDRTKSTFKIFGKIHRQLQEEFERGLSSAFRDSYSSLRLEKISSVAWKRRDYSNCKKLGIDFALWEITFNLGTGSAYLYVQWKAVPNQMLRETDTNDFHLFNMQSLRL